MARVCKYSLSWVWTAKPRAFCVLWVATILCSFKLHRQECLLILRRFLRVCLCLRKLVTECLLAVDSGGDIVRKKKKGQPQLIWMQTGFGSNTNEESGSVISALVYDHTFQL